MFGRSERTHDVGAMDASAFGVLSRRVAAIAPDERREWTLGCWAVVHGMATLTLDNRLVVSADELRSVLSLLMGVDG